MPLSPKDRQYLLTLARQTIVRVLEGEDPPPVDLAALPEDLRGPGASFVTLTIGGGLRGCIGSIEPRQPLALDVRENALGAAFRDPRFPPLAKEELDRLHIEVSVLTRPQPLPYTSPDDLLVKLRPRVDGVIIERGWYRATFLPQVWEKLPDPREFLAHLCLKAGLPSDDYRRPGLQVLIYQVEKFEEEKQ
ncbi:MAG TPA: AmmeMemoRadiSam system protein A [Chloroflexi bacterium]|nr:AmmeMemoRadiSam system protein A [Chloroflexota bacterium]